MSVSVLGLGPMGQALAGALLASGRAVTVWNRTEAKADELRARGAAWAASPAEAVAASRYSLVNVVDHTVADAVLGAAGAALSGRTVVGLSSDTPEASRRTAGLVTAAGGRYLDGAIMTPTATIGTAAASILCAGPKEAYDDVADVLEALAAPAWVGTDYGRAAAYDMALLNLFWTSVSGALSALKVASANGISAEEFLPHALGIVGILDPIVTELAERVGADRHDDADAPVSSVAASLRHLIAASEDAGVDAAALRGFGRAVEAAVAAGHGGDEVSRIFQYV